MLSTVTEWARNFTIAGSAWLGSAQVTSLIANATTAAPDHGFVMPSGAWGIASVLLVSLLGLWKSAENSKKTLEENKNKEIAELKAAHRTEMALIEESRKQAWKITEKARRERSDALTQCVHCPGITLRQKTLPAPSVSVEEDNVEI